ncbi:hypothetical protein BGZ83_006068 [Gryganskiella cystojenkinii]|nr:hypothetical protein BGZ83_006068 [Gryganskiella cystojenkinii]
MSASPPPSEGPITLNVKTLESQTHAVSLPVTETVLQLKERLATLLEVPSPRQRLIFRGRVLADDKALTEYSLQDGHTIHLVTRPADAPTNNQNDAPRRQTGRATSTRPFQFETGDYHVSIIGIDEMADPQRIMQAIAGSMPTNMTGSAPTVIHFGADPSTLSSLFSPGNNANLPSSTPSGIQGRASRGRASGGGAQSVPLGAGLPHLATIDAELTRAATQLRNVETILSQPADQLESVELEPLDVPDLESAAENRDGDSTAIARMGSMLTQLSNTSRAMANHLQTLSTQYGQSIEGVDERQRLQLASLRAARAMYRLASVQNTVFPMLANANFVGTSPDAVAYRFQPPARIETVGIPIPSNTLANLLARTPAQVGGTTLPGLPFSTLARSGSRAPLGLIPSIVAHARAQARNVVNATMASAPGSSSSSVPASTRQGPSSQNSGMEPVGRLILGPNGNLSYSRDPPARSTSRSGTNSRPAQSSSATGVGRQALTPGATTDDEEEEFMRQFTERVLASHAELHGAELLDAPLSATWPVTSGRGVSEPGSSSSAPVSRRRERPDDFVEDDRNASRRRRIMTDLAEELGSFLGDREARGAGSTRSDAYPEGAFASASSVATNARNISTQPSSASRAALSRTSSNDARHQQPTASAASEASSTVSSPSPSSPSIPSSSSNNNHVSSSSSAGATSPAYNLGRIGVFISAILRMVDQPREDGSPRTLADVICNDPQNNNTPLQDLVRDVAESLTVRETRLVVEGYPASLRNIHPVLNTFIRERALHSQQITENNLEAVAVMFSHGIMNAVHVEEILESLTPPASIQISSADIRRISIDVLREHFRRLIYLVVAAPAGRESSWPTFARDLILWMRDVVGAWRVAFYGLFPERDQAIAQRIATHVVGSAIHANGRRWVELSNRATNTLVNVLCANIVPRRRGEEQTGGLVGGAWPLMATTPRQNSSRSQTCMAPSLLGSTAPPAPLGPSTSTSTTTGNSYGAFGVMFGSSSRGSGSSSNSTTPTSTNTTTTRTSAAPSAPVSGNNTGNTPSSPSISETLSENLERMIRESVGPLPGMASAIMDFEMMDMPTRIALRDQLFAASGRAVSSATRAGGSNVAAATTASTEATTSTTPNTPSRPSSTNIADTNSRRTRIEEVEDEEMP